MKAENFNKALREMFIELINDGVKKRHICGLTLGGQNEPQLDSFIKGNDFGLKPLQRLVYNMGYDFNIVILPREENDEKTVKFIEEVNYNFLATCKTYLVEKLEDMKSVSPTQSSVAKTDDFITELFNSIIVEKID